MNLIPQAVAAVTGAVDGVVLERFDKSAAAAKANGVPGPAPYPLLYRAGLALAGAGLTAFTEVDANIATALLVAGAFGLTSMAGAAPFEGRAAFGFAPAGWVATPYVTADGRFVQGGVDPADAPAYVAGLLTPRESLRGYGASQPSGELG